MEKLISMNGTIYYRNIGILCITVLLILFKPITGSAAENREDYRAVFDTDYYYNQYPDLQATIGYDQERLFSHFVSTGAREGRSGNEEFNLRSYVFNNRDLLDVYKTDLSAYCRHYMELGKAEGRISQPQDNKQGLIGTYTTRYDITLPRAVNIEIAVQRINGIVLQPREGFSFSNAILSRTPQNGYVMAPAIGRYEYGGGICQVSSTLYAAMCHALLPATERHPHSSNVSYLPTGLDATISEGYKDLKFINPYQEPLTILAETDEGVLTVSLRLGVVEQEDTSEDNTNEGMEQTLQEVTENPNEAAENEVVGPASELVEEPQETAQ